MHSILKRSAALIASAATLLGGGLLMAGTAQADGIGLPVMTIHPAASTSYPKELVNGGFQTFGNRIVDKRSGGWQYLSFVDGNGMAMEGSSERPWAKVDGWDAVKFGWKSNDSVSGHRGIVEVQRFRTAVKGSTGNVWGEIAAATQGKYLYQDIDTANTSDAMYTVRLKHASRNKDARDSMQVLVGAPGREKPVTMRRTIANAGDKAGEESTTITSTGTGQDDQWDTYEGTVLVPRGQDVTRFTFKSVADSNSAGRPDSAEGNLIDDVVFTKAYQLTYDANGGVKTRTSQIDYTTGGETRGKVKTVRDSPAPPAGQEKIVNGDFEYSGTGAGLSDSPFNYVSLSRKSYYYKDSRNVNHRVALPAGFDAKRFAWKSDQTGKDLGNPPYEQAGDVQVWNRYDGSNHYAELTAAQAGSAIYQDIDTESDSDVQYIVSLRHASLNASHLDSMQVLIGAPGHETPVTMTRVTANGYGDKVGESSDTIATRVSNPKPADREDSDHTGQWETYTGTVTVPAGRPVTRFTFRNVSSKSAWNGNLIDDIAFTKARRLDYDANGGTKAQASQIGYRTDATQGAVETVASKTLPTELVNGSFDYLLDGGWDTISPVGRGGYADDRGWGRFTSVDPASGEYIQNAGQNPATFDSTGKWVKWPGFDAAKFGWASDQKGGQPQGGVGLTDRPNAVELQQDSVTGNTYAEIVGSERGKAILQKIDTQHDSDTVYTVRFDHASLSKEHADSMQVLVNGKPVTMTRVTSNKAGDEQGWTGTSITTHATNTNRFQHDGQWATYEGKVTIPANTPVSTFTFKALNAVDPTKGNLIDNLTFKIAYRLSYDANGGTKAKASQISSMTEGKASETDGKVRTVADENVRYGSLANGDFSYPSFSDIQENEQGTDADLRTFLKSDDGTLWYNMSVTDLSKYGKIGQIPGFDSSRFAWSSTENGSRVELQQDRNTKNTYAEIVAQQDNTSIYQNVSTCNGGVLYKIRLKHASRQSSHADRMQVLVGSDTDHATPVEMTRVTSNGHGDKVGGKSTIITTKVSNTDPRDHGSQWETYEGYYQVPEGQKNTVFMFKSLEGFKEVETLPGNNVGNLVDDIEFSRSYKLTYDKNASDATGKVPSNQRGKENAVEPAESKTTGNVKTVADNTSNLPDHLVNGTFDYRGNEIINENQRVYGQHDTTYLAIISAKTGVIGNPLHSKLDNWDSGKFGWKSNDDTAGADTVEVQRRNHTPYPTNAGNVWGEIAAAKRGKYIYQDIATTPGVVYKWSLKHASRNADQDDSMQVMIGEPGKTVAQQATRTTSNGSDKTGSVGTTITTHGTAQDGRWETYTGDYLATSTTTRFTFRSVRDSNGQGLDFTAEGNCVDDLSFDKAYKLSYDKNSSDATGSVPSNQYGKENTVQPAKSKTTGSVGLAADKTVSGLTVHDLKKNDKGKVPSSSKADSTQPAAFKAPDAKVEAIASRAAGDEMAVNGGFDTPKWSIAKEGQGLPWVYVKPNAGTIRSYAQAMAGQTGVKAGGLTAATFAWQDVDATGGNQNFELHREKDGNTAADVHAGRTVAQTVATTPGAAYTFSIRHSGRSKGNAGGVTLLTGSDKDHLTPVKLTRTTVSKTGAKYGDRTGDVGTVAYTHSDSTDATEGGHEPWDHSDDWESYEGTVIIPAGQSRTMIAYRGVAKDGTLTASANDSIIDDLSFRLAYKLSYDANGGAKTNASKISASSNGTVRLAATRTSVPSHALEDTDVPADCRSFTFDTTRTRLADARFDGNWTTTRDEAGGSIHWPTRLGASATLPNTGTWTDPDGVEHRINATIALKQWNGGNIGQLNRFDGNGKIVGDGLFWINVVYDNTKVPASVRKALGGIDTSKRVGCQWTVSFTYEDGTPVPSTFKGVTGFNDLDGFDARPDLKFEGVQLLSGFDGAYRTRDAELASYGTNGYAGIKHDAGDESNLNGAQQVRHRLAATWTGPTFTYSYDLENPTGRTDGVRMTFGMPVTRTQVLTYKANGGTGQVPSRTEAGKTETAASRMNGTVRLAADRDTEPESGTTTDDRKVLTDTIARQDDGTSQRTITRSDGSVQVQTIADTGAVSGCQVYYPAGAKITLATAKADSDCWDSSQISKTNRTFYGWSANTDANDKDVPVADTMDRATLDANAETQITMPARAKTVYALWAINPTLTYDVNAPAGTNAPVAPASKTVPYNTAATDTSGWVAGDAGKITGYTFQGWYTGKDGAAKYDFTAKLTSDATVYAKWTANACTVKYDAGGGQGSMPDQKFTFGVPQNLTRNTFTRSGWAFTGWKRADTGDAYQDGQQVANLICTPNGGAPFVAQWTPNAAAINYNANPPAGRTAGGQGTANWTGHTGDTQAIGANGWTVDGYTFIGWNTSADGKGTAYAPGTTWIANGTLTLYAQWTPGQAGLTYDGNGATGGKTDPQPGKTDEKINVRDNGFTRDGYMFVTWNTQAGCKGKAVDPGDEWTLQGSGTLYACWAGTVQTLAYHGNGATGGNTAVQSGKTGDELTTNANGFTRDGYTFVRWDTAKDGSGTAYGEGKNGVSQYTMKPAGNDLYAIWKANPASIVYRNGYPNTTGSTPDTTGSTGDTVTVSQNGFDRPGYTFTGWSTSKRGDPSLNPGDKHTLEPGTTTVWAQWKANPAHLVYNSNVGGIGSETRTVDGVVDQTVKTIDNPFDRPGYTFSGWNTQADGKGKAYDPGADCTLTANDKSTPKNTSVLYAQWTINKVTLKFDPNGGVGGYPSINTDAFGSVTIPKDAKEPKVTRPGFRFTGWSLKKTPDKDETLLTPGKDTVSMPAEGEVAVYAQWEPAMTTLPFTGGNAQIPTIWLWAGLAFLIIAAGAFSPMIRLRMGAGSKGRHAGRRPLEGIPGEHGRSDIAGRVGVHASRRR
ncbi:InlB B-repeat-containing protein [Bifidobacterium longum subsp. infantis]|uniref:InlB B-repeat-containing protein n=2 Tax=Bifidobacterium longum TaxID=216816 RepID=UPI000AF16E18|nr:InlB B-repeat-containing protein [Bifidobacterium longum]MCB5289417.1 InlB B-repeat-containing protein [Bifidobacterium longum subsp. infantis]